MKITKETDYAVRIVSYLSKVTEIVGAKQISEETDVPQRFALKILRKLCIAEILESFKGTAGGYKLNSNPKDITMLRVIEVTQGSISINDCLSSSNQCQSACNCSIRKAFYNANEALVKALSNTTFDQL